MERFSQKMASVVSMTARQILKQTGKNSVPLSPMSWSNRRHMHLTLSCLKRVEEVNSAPDLFTNPVERLQPLLQVPIIPESDNAFRPTRQEMEMAAKYFEYQGFKGESFKFLGSWPNPHIMPKWDVPEVIIIMFSFICL